VGSTADVEAVAKINIPIIAPPGKLTHCFPARSLVSVLTELPRLS